MRHARKAIVAALVSIVIATLATTACSSGSTPSASESKQTEPLVIEAQTYKLTLPSEWTKGAQYTVADDDKAVVYYADHSDLPILRIAYSNAPMINGGDIANGLIYYKEAPDGRRLEIRATNYPYLFWYDMSPANVHGKNYSYLTDSQKIEIMKLETGNEINLTELYSFKTEEENTARLLHFDHLKPLLEQGLEFV